jgi:hypothetical protein
MLRDETEMLEMLEERLRAGELFDKKRAVDVRPKRSPRLRYFIPRARRAFWRAVVWVATALRDLVRR